MGKRTVGFKPALFFMVAAAAPLLVVGSAAADRFEGTPGEPACHGESIARLVLNGERSNGGLRAAAQARELSVQLLQANVWDFCMMGDMGM